jgi:hypothetical protein
MTWTIGVVDSIVNGETNISRNLARAPVVENVTMRDTTLEVVAIRRDQREIMVKVQVVVVAVGVVVKKVVAVLRNATLPI